MTGEMHEFSRLIGMLQSSVETLTRQWGEQDRKATEGRRELYRKFDEIKTEVTELAGRVGRMAEEISDMKPSVDTFDQLHQQGIGSKKTMAIGWTVLVGLIGAMSAGIVELIHLFWPKH